MIFPSNNLPTSSQPWAREITKQLSNIIDSDNSNQINNTARDNQLNSSIIALSSVVSDVTNALQDIGLLEDTVLDPSDPTKINGANLKASSVTATAIAANSITSDKIAANTITANDIASGTITATQISSSYIYAGSISADQINAGTLTADFINGGTITASNVDLTAGSYGIKVGASGESAYLNCFVGSGDGTTFGMAGFSGSISGGSPTVANTGWVAAFYPRTNGGPDLGTSGRRWNTVYATTATINTSDAREKTDIVTSALGLDFVNQLHPVSYQRIDGTRTHYGLIAQEVEQVLIDNSISTENFAGFIRGDVNDPESILGLRYSEFISPMIKAIQELTTRIETLEKGA